MRAWPLLIGPAAVAACASLPTAAVPLIGEWGGRHVGLSLGETSGTVEYDCAAGTMEAPVALRPDGSFEAFGTHTPGWGGPERSDEVRPTYSVRYNGTVRGSRMTLTGRVENGVLLGPFSLTKGSEPIIFRCL